MNKMDNFNENKLKRAVIVLANRDDACYKFEVAIEYKNSISFEKGATWIEVDGVKIYLTGRCEYVLMEDKAIGYNRGYVEDIDIDYEFQEIKDYYDDYVE